MSGYRIFSKIQRATDTCNLLILYLFLGLSRNSMRNSASRLYESLLYGQSEVFAALASTAALVQNTALRSETDRCATLYLHFDGTHPVVSK